MIPSLVIGEEITDTNTIEPAAYQLNSYLFLLKGKKVGAVINQTSKIDKTNLIDSLQSIGIQITKIFTPEHGFEGKTDAGSAIDDQKYRNAIPIVSLYGKKIIPSSDDLKGTDIMLFDLQDVGVRFYTYLSTLNYVMQACAENHLQLIVLDRPNPNGFYIDGPVLEEKFRSYVGLNPVPVVYGMTIGEYALMINGERWLRDSLVCQLTVIRCLNYRHDLYYQLPVNPSPNLRNMKSVYLFPSIAFFEGTTVSEGRGTEFPFLMIGYPDFPDHSFSFVPKSTDGAENPKLKGVTCYGYDLRKLNIDSLLTLRCIDLKFLIEMYNKLKFSSTFFNDYFDKLAGNQELRTDIISGKSEEEIRDSWKPGLEKFKRIRAKYLLYPDFK